MASQRGPVQPGHRRDNCLLKTLGVSDIYPSMTAINLSKKTFRNHLGAFDEASIESFLNDMLKGKGRNSAFTEDLKLKEGKTEL